MKARSVFARTTDSNRELADNLNKSSLPAAMLAAYFEENQDKNHLLQMLQQHFAGNQVTIRDQIIQPGNVSLIGGANNINFLIETADKQISMVLQIGVRPYAVINACKVLGRRKVWLAEQYGEQVCYTAESAKLDNGSRCNRALNPFMTGEYGYFVMMEKCDTSLTEKVTAFHAAKTSSDELISFAQKITKQLVGTLSKISKKNIIWTDLKPGNILLRGDQDQVVISDMKAFRSATQVVRKQHGGLLFSEMTSGYLSEGMKEAMIKPDLTRESAKKLWEMEYSYQLGTLLYFIMTGQEYLAPESPAEKYSLLSFDDETLKSSPEGRVRSIIDLLTACDMNIRLSFEKAWDLLGLVFDEQSFNEKKNAFVNEIMYRQASSTKQLRDLIRERHKSQQTIRSTSGTIFARNISPRGAAKNRSDNLMEVGNAIPASPSVLKKLPSASARFSYRLMDESDTGNNPNSDNDSKSPKSPKSPGRRFSRRFP